MPPKSPADERALILARDARRKYGVRVLFQVQSLAHVGGSETTSYDLPTGAIATLAPARKLSWEGGVKLQLTVEGFSSAEHAETAGLRAAQALLLASVSCNFGLRLHYHTHRPGAVFDRLASEGATMWGEGTSGWSPDIVREELLMGFAEPALDRRMLLSMELFAGAFLELNDRARFVMLVSALEPLAEQKTLPVHVSDFVAQAVELLDQAPGFEPQLRNSIRGRLQQLSRESVRQSLNRLCAGWFPGDKLAWEVLDRAYALRSELLHEGMPKDLDIQFREEGDRVAGYIRSIYAKASRRTLRSPAAAV